MWFVLQEWCVTALTHWSWITLLGFSNNAPSGCCQWAGCTGGLWRRHDRGENMKASGTFIASRNLARRQDGMTSSASLQQWLYIYTRASHLCNSESCWIWTRRDEITMCNMGFVPFSLHMAHVQCYWGKVYSRVGFLFLSSTLPQKGMCANVICLLSTCSLFCCFFCSLIKST